MLSPIRELEIWTSVCPVRVYQPACFLHSGGAPEMVRLQQVPGGGWILDCVSGAWDVLGVSRVSEDRWAVRTPSGEFSVEVLPDPAAPPPGDLPLPRRREYYDGRFRRLFQNCFPGGFRAEFTGSGSDPFFRWSGRFCRVVWSGGGAFTAGMALYPFQGEEASSAFLTSSLQWWAHCFQTRRRFGKDLLLVVPSGFSPQIAGRLLLLDRGAVRPSLWEYDSPMKVLAEIDVAEAAASPAAGARFEFPRERPLWDNRRAKALLERFHPALVQERTPHPFDRVVCRGLPVAEVCGTGDDDLRFGFFQPLAPIRSDSDVEDWVAQVVRTRAHPPPDPHHPAFRLFPERWMESRLLENISNFHPGFSPGATLRQVPTYRGMGRSVIDVLALEDGGRLHVLELKMEKDDSALFQALDYWDRVREGAASGLFHAMGYFPGSPASAGSPLLWLALPLFRQHRNLGALSALLRPDIAVHMAECALDWRGGWRTVRRTRLR